LLPLTPQIDVALDTQVCAITGVATVVKARITAAANTRDFNAGFDVASSPPVATPLGEFTNSDATCMTPSVRLKTSR
jgi:hypothetical protein